MAIILTIANQKGGVGKTTTSVNLAAALSKLGKRILLVDLDPQGNATMGSGIDKRRITRSVYHVMIGHAKAADATQVCEASGYSLLPANRELAGAEIELVEFEARESRLKHALEAVGDQYDFILIDSPPSLSLLTLNGLCAAHGVIIPMQCEYYALEGLTDLVNTIRKVHANFNTSIRIIGILRVMFDSRITLSQQVSAQLEEHFKDKVFRSIIPRNIRLAEAPSHGMPGVNFDPSSRGAMGYVEFAAELVERMPHFRVAATPTGTARSATAPGVAPGVAPAIAPRTATGITPGAEQGARPGTVPPNGASNGPANVPTSPARPGTSAAQIAAPEPARPPSVPNEPDEASSMSVHTYAPHPMGARHPVARTGTTATMALHPAEPPGAESRATGSDASPAARRPPEDDDTVEVQGAVQPIASHGEPQR